MLLTCLVTAGCASGLSTGSVVRASLPQGAECRCDRVEHFELGPFTLALAKLVVGWVDDVDEEERAIVDGLRRVEVAEYALEGCRGAGGAELDRLLARRGWHELVAARDGEAFTRLLIRPDREGRTRGLLVVERDRGSLEVVILEGDLDPALRLALEEHPEEAASRVRAAAR
jgi:hypothetical protein